MAEVFKARDSEAFDRLVAIKRIKPEYAFDEEMIELLESEGRTLGALNHPNLLQVYSFHQESDVVYLALEFFEGFSLYQLGELLLTRKKILPLPFVLGMLGQVANALDYLHRRHILHTTLAARNILVGKNGMAKLIDFSSSQAAFNRRAAGAQEAWAATMDLPPERILGKPFDARSDIFQLGLVLFKEATGRSPYGEAEAKKEERAILDFDIRRAPLPPTLPPPLHQILGKALASDPEQRYGSAHDFERDLAKLLHLNYPGYGPEDAAGFLREEGFF